MAIELASSTVVIVARQFNPSIIRDFWLINTGILAPEDFRAGSIYTDMVAQVQSKPFSLFVAPEQCQFSPLVPTEEQQTLIVDKVGRLVRALPHTPYTGVGLNFHWHLVPENRPVEALTRQLFFVSSPLYAEFDVEDARFGAYMSKNMLGFRLNLDVKPAHQMPQNLHFIQFAYNFHLELPSDRDKTAQIEEAMRRWNEAREESLRLTQIAAGSVT